MRKLQKIFFISFLFMGIVAQAQETRIVKGKVISSLDNQPLSSASVMVKGKSSGTATGNDGLFSLSVPTGNTTLVISYLGYTSFEKAMEAGVSEITIVLEKNKGDLGEVVVTALGTQRQKRALTYAVQTIKPKDILEIRDPNIVNTLQGKIAGAVISQASGGLGSSSNLVLRGNRSLSGNSGALYVIDGVPIDNYNFRSSNSDFGGDYNGTQGTNTINPDDIESLTVLRGASASALYGSAAGNGVVLITTKKGKDGKISVNINSGFSQESVWGLPLVQNKYGQGIGGVLNPSLGSSWGAEMNGQAYTNHLGTPAIYSPQPDNIKNFFNKANTINNSIGISAGNAKTQTYLSYSNTLANGIIPLNKLSKHLVNLRVTNKITDKLTVDAKINYFHQEINHTPYNGENNAPVFDLYQIPRSVSLDVAKDYSVFAAGKTRPTPWPATLNSIYQNPYWALNNINVNQNLDKISGFITLKYDIASWLSIIGRANYEKSFSNNNTSVSDGTILQSNAGGNYSEQSNSPTNQWYDVMLLGTKNVNKNFAVEYQAGAIFTDFLSSSLSGSANGLSIDNSFNLNYAVTRGTANSIYHTRTNAVYARGTLSYKQFLFLDGSFRNDWSSTLPSPYRYSYPSIGFSAIVSDIVKLPSFISYLKLNGSLAQVGNSAGAYQLMTNFYYSGLPSLGVGLITRSGTKALSNLKPEITKSYEGSLNIRFLEDRIGIEATIYKTNSFNQILNVLLPAATGFTNQLINAGNIQNNGFEFIINAVPIKNKNFNWNIDFNMGRNTNKLVALSETVKEINGFIRWSAVNTVEGRPLGEIYGYGWKQDAKGNYLVTDAGLPIGTAESKYLGNLNPKASMGLSNTFTYKNFSLRVLVDGKIGGTVISGNEGNLAFDGITKATEQNREVDWILPGVTTSGSVNQTKIDAQSFWTTVSGKRYGSGEFFAYDATNFRLRELSLGYKIPLNKTIIQSARVSLFARNLFWLYRGSSKLDIPGLGKRKLSIDPDMALGTFANGSDYGALPSSRLMGVNLQLSF